MAENALIVGAGKGLSASLARRLAREGMNVALAARNIEKLADLAQETNARRYACDASDASSVTKLFEGVEADVGVPDLVVCNVANRYRGPIDELDPAQVRRSYEITALSAFLVAQRAAKSMLRSGHGSIFFTGATASVNALAHSVPFSMPKFAVRGLAQALARELAPRNIHVAHFVIDGGIATSWKTAGEAGPADKWLDPDAIADTYLQIHRQHRSAWTWEIELRPWTESF
jgi:NAD(P)-dependent dehydrogenase (short-subunit alcohol dehydrogenase family)